MWPWHADRPNHKGASPHAPSATHCHNCRHTHQTSCQPQPRVAICPGFIPPKHRPRLPLSHVPKHWLDPSTLPSVPAARYTPPEVAGPSPLPRLTCVRRRPACLPSIKGIPHITRPVWRKPCPPTGQRILARLCHATGPVSQSLMEDGAFFFFHAIQNYIEHLMKLLDEQNQQSYTVAGLGYVVRSSIYAPVKQTVSKQSRTKMIHTADAGHRYPE